MIGSTLNYLNREADMITANIDAHYDDYDLNYVFELEVNEKNDIKMVSFEGHDLDEFEYEDSDFERAKSVFLSWYERIEEFAKSGKQSESPLED